MALGAEHVGRRVVVRRRLLDERGPSGGPAMTDVLGVLAIFDEQTLVVRRDDGEVVTVARADVVAAKPVPPRAALRHRVSSVDLQHVCAAGWQAPIERRLGRWLLRAGGTFSGRTSSALAVGDPGMPLDAALERVNEFYGTLGLPVQAQVVVDSGTMHAMHARSWTRSRPDQADVLVQIAPVAAARRTRPQRGRLDDVRLRERLSDDWLDRSGRATGADAAAVRSVLASGELVAFAQLGEPAVAIGRAVVTGAWLGLSAVQVDPSLQRQGLGSAIVRALLDWGATRGAESAYLQRLADNEAASALYATYGFVTHHSYRYLRPPA